MKGIGIRRLLNRRDFLAGLAGAALLVVAGCTSEESEGPTGRTPRS
jgi:TAT (twin-arginine translocation) pathway signal sequence